MSATTATPAETRALRDKGQERSLSAVSPQLVTTALNQIRHHRAGVDLSINDLRPLLDALGFPERARAGLFRQALAAGLLEPLYITAGPYTVPVTVPSTGRSARHQTVRVYRRTDTS